MSDFYQNSTIEVDKEEFKQMTDLLLKFEAQLIEKLEENRELTSKIEDLESLMKLREKAPSNHETIERMKKLLKESSNG